MIRLLARTLGFLVGAAVMIAILMLLGNLAFHTPRDVPSRALDPDSATCRSEDGWDVLAKPRAEDASSPGVANDEWWAIDHSDKAWRARFSCSVQHHLLPGYVGLDGTRQAIGYDLAFLEVQEDGKPYALRQLCAEGEPDCHDEGYGPVRKTTKGQLEVILEKLAEPGPHYVMVFVHGWRHDASIGDATVAEFRDYAAHAARFIEDRATLSPGTPKAKVLAVYIGWRGARTDENALHRRFGEIGQAIGTFSSVLTLFDRKPVSEAVASAVLGALREVEKALGIGQPLASVTALPVAQANRMIVFGHSLGGNLLATALEPDLLKKVARHSEGSYMLPPLGDLVVLINPASEATKWTSIQRAVWDRIAVGLAERRPMPDYEASHRFFRIEQRPILLSVTAALDWPPGGRREIDCAPRHGLVSLDQSSSNSAAISRNLAQTGAQYDWATYDLFPAFKGDFRPLADTISRIGTENDPHDACSERAGGGLVVGTASRALSALLRVLPFMQTDSEFTHTIGQLDPPRGIAKAVSYTGSPIGTTHELRGFASEDGGPPRARLPAGSGLGREVTLVVRVRSCPTYGWVVGV